jgi:hypothetical protein
MEGRPCRDFGFVGLVIVEQLNARSLGIGQLLQLVDQRVALRVFQISNAARNAELVEMFNLVPRQGVGLPFRR